MKIFTRSEAKRIEDRFYKTGQTEPRKKSSPLTSLTDAQLIEKLSKTKDQRKAERISREIARRLTAERYQSRHS